MLLTAKNAIFVLPTNFAYFVTDKYTKLKYIVLKLLTFAQYTTYWWYTHVIVKHFFSTSRFVPKPQCGSKHTRSLNFFPSYVNYEMEPWLTDRNILLAYFMGNLNS